MRNLRLLGSILNIILNKMTWRRLSCDVGLPRGSTLQEHILDLLKTLSCGLGEEEEHVDGHHGAENAKEYINLPLDVLERGRNKVSESEVKDPVGGGTESDGTATDTEGE